MRLAKEEKEANLEGYNLALVWRKLIIGWQVAPPSCVLLLLLLSFQLLRLDRGGPASSSLDLFLVRVAPKQGGSRMNS